MRPSLPWLGQGDVFSDVPIVSTALDSSGHVTASLVNGPAILLTHDCTLDKANNRGVPRIERMTFARLRCLSVVDNNRKALLRKNEFEPTEALYVSSVAPYGEVFLVISESYFIPAAYFAPARDIFQHPEAEEQVPYLHPTQMDTRIGRLEEDELQLLRRKMNGFWTRTVPRTPADASVVDAARGLARAAAATAGTAGVQLRGVATRLLYLK